MITNNNLRVLFQCLIALFILSALATPAQAQDDQLEVLFFFVPGCMHCNQALGWLNDLQKEHPQIQVTKKNLHQAENQELLMKFESTLDFSASETPIIIIGEHVLTGSTDNLKSALQRTIEKGIQMDFRSPLSLVGETERTDTQKLLNRLTLPAVLIAAAVDSINPCAFAVLVILLGTILVAKKASQILRTGLAFSAAIFISYFLMGFGLYSAIQASNVSSGFYFGIAILAILAGLISLKDFFWPDHWVSLEVPNSWKPIVERLVEGVSSTPGAFLVGFGVSVFLLPCTSGPYIAILGLLSRSKRLFYASGLLAVYNFVFIIPMLFITFAVHRGFLTTARVEEWRKRKNSLLRLVAGVLMLALGTIMLVTSNLGYL